MENLAAKVIFIGVLTSLGWGLRGQFGHTHGAAIAGAFAGMGLWIAFGAGPNFWQMAACGAVGALAMSIGGTMSYGLIVGYTREHELGRALYGFFGLFVVGGLWGFISGSGLGMFLSRRNYGLADLIPFGMLVFFGVIAGYRLLVEGFDLHMSPPRSDAWAGVLGGAVAGGLYLALAMKDYTALRMGLWGLLGFGLGFIIADLACMGCERAGWRIDAWKVAEHTMGFLGGISLAIAVARQGRPIEPVEIAPMLRVISVLMIAWFVPYLNVTNTFEYLIAEGKITRWPMALFQVLAIVALFASILYLSWLAPRWDGDGASPKLLIGVMAFLTFLGIVKDGPSLGVGRLDVYLTFIGLFAVGSVMAVVFSR